MADKIQNARLAFIKVGSTTFSAEKASSLSIRSNVIETTNKGNTASASFLPDVYQATVTAQRIVVYDGTTGDLQDLDATFLTSILLGSTQAVATLIFVLSASAPTVTLSASAYVTQWDVEATAPGVIEGQCAFQLTGDITRVETAT